jgi:cytochrome c oxidase assembly protein subunit 15
MTAPPTAGIHRFALLCALATLALVGIGGLVTSHGVGMAVPDWPNTYGYNMFFFPISQWVGGIFYEHSHRLFASGVGLLTTILALWLHGRNARPLLRWGGLVFAALGVATGFSVPRHRADGIVLGITGLTALLSSFVWPRCEPAPKWMRRLGLLAFVAVVLQGILGGLRVVLFTDQIGIFHATLAQLFFVLMCSLAVFTSPRWQNRKPNCEIEGPNHAHRLAPLFLATTLLILGQLVLGATMRHQHAGLAIPDFPLAYGKLWPAMDPASIAKYNQQRIEVLAANPITSVQITLQLVHRLLAGLILFAVGASAWFARKRLGGRDSVSRFALLWLGPVLIQVLLGAATIWSNKAADIATLHVLTGALLLAFGAILTIVAYDQRRAARPRSAALRTEVPNLSAFGAVPSSAAHVD